MWEGAAIVLLAAGILFWLDSLRARERALKAGRAACERHELQFLDDTVSVTRVRLGRDDDGQLRIARTYTFEFSDTGNNRRNGAIVMMGGELQDLQLEPFRMQVVRGNCGRPTGGCLYLPQRDYGTVGRIAARHEPSRRRSCRSGHDRP